MSRKPKSSGLSLGSSSLVSAAESVPAEADAARKRRRFMMASFHSSYNRPGGGKLGVQFPLRLRFSGFAEPVVEPRKPVVRRGFFGIQFHAAANFTGRVFELLALFQQQPK